MQANTSFVSSEFDIPPRPSTAFAYSSPHYQAPIGRTNSLNRTSRHQTRNKSIDSLPQTHNILAPCPRKAFLPPQVQPRQSSTSQQITFDKHCERDDDAVAELQELIHGFRFNHHEESFETSSHEQTSSFNPVPTSPLLRANNPLPLNVEFKEDSFQLDPMSDYPQNFQPLMPFSQLKFRQRSLSVASRVKRIGLVF